MITLKLVQTSLNPNRHRHAVFFTKRPTNSSFVSLCKSKDSNSEPESPPPPPEGDAKKQEMLVRMAMIEAQKVRLTGYLDETSAQLTQFVEDANAEIEKIGEDALKGLDEASARIMENMESQMQEFEESAELNRMEIEKKESELIEFEGQMEEARNEGLFFKSLGQKKPLVEKEKAKEEAKKIEEITKEKVGSKTRRNIYLALIGLLVIAITDSFISPSSDWRKVAVLGAILVPLILQFLYEQGLVSETERMGKEKSEEEKK
ncbi:hypothetical protein Ddye_010390 [Dipteronia dyeriana]|uniref:Uncharacterized protein n=1 Tax=Dipteronia dyeriana TaxID=168575 RepID=A0AAD9XE50_9ROSI|nr:hypothetical protein Ddye_010390 [Dipteronia dyeriana]